MRRLSASLVLVLLAVSAHAATYQVGPGKTYATLSAVPALVAGDVVEVYSGTYNECKRLTASGTASAPITIRGMGTTRPVFDGTGLNLTGAGSVPRALIQVEGSYNVAENIEFKNARGDDKNGAGIRVTGGNNVTIRNCKITACEMGMMSGSCANLLVESCEIASNGILKNGDFAKSLADEGLTGSENLLKQPREITVVVLFNNTLFGKLQPQTYSAKAGKSGTSK
jgi:hypothetical protein